MQSGDRQQVLQPGLAERGLDLFGDGAALAGDQRRGDPAGRARQHGDDPPRHLRAQTPQPLAPAAAGRIFGAGDAVRRAIAVADPADPGEKGLALHIVAARQDLARHRIECGAHGDPVAGGEQVARRCNVHPHAARLFVGIEPGQWVGGDDDSPAAVERVDVDHPPGQRHRPEAALQSRRLAFPGGLANQSKAGAEQREPQRRLARQRQPMEREGEPEGEDRAGDPEPQRRLEIEREINPDPGPEQHRQP